jgi:sn-glycerol 3-phosphate transport system permease protein
MEPKGLRLAGRYVVLAVVAFIVLFPIYAAVIGSLKPGNQVFKNPLIPTDATFDTLREAWTSGRLGRALVNSALTSVIVTVAQVVTSLLAAYAFVFLKFPGRSIAFGVFIATLLIPFEATALYNFDTVQNAELFGQTLIGLNTLRALTVPFLATAFGTFLIRQVFMTLPKEMAEAAKMDGLGHWGFLREVAIPLVRPSIGALGLFSFLATWNQYLWPNLVTTEQKWFTVQASLKSLAAAGIDKPNSVIAGTVIVAIPIFVLLIAFQKQLIRGLTAGAVKG